MMRIVLALAILMFGFLASKPSPAQVLNSRAAPEAVNHAALGFGFDHGAVVEASYDRTLFPFNAALPISAVTKLQIPSCFSLGDGGVESGAVMHLVDPSGWGVAPRFFGSFRWVKGELFNVVQSGVILGTMAGYFHPKWMAALDLAWDKSTLTYVSPTERYQETAYSDAKGTFYGSTGGTFRIGVATSIQLFDTVDVSLRLGGVTSEQFNATGLPIYALLGSGMKF